MLGPVRAAIRGTELTLKLLGKMASLDLELFQRQLGVELSAVLKDQKALTEISFAVSVRRT